MKNKFKSALLPVMLLLAICLLCACGAKTRLDEVSEDGYTVSIRFEANGGEFTTNCYSIVDAYDISDMAVNANGMVELALIAPDNELRGANDTFTVAKAGYFLAGWYERIENEDGTYSYTNKWDFENGRLIVDPNKSYSASEPELVLYAVWVPQFEINFYNIKTGELLDTEIFSPDETTLQVPDWDTSTGKMKMYKFPSVSGYTFEAAYYDAEGTNEAEGNLIHHGYVDPETGVAVNPSMDVYIEYTEGNWYQIYNAQQLVDNATKSGCYRLMNDLDFTGVEWPNTFMTGDFNGIIESSNGCTISNVTIVQTNNSATRFGLFGSLSADAVIRNVTFQNITATIQAGTRVNGVSFGLFAGSISAEAKLENVALLDSTLLIHPDHQTSADYVFGMICGTGDMNRIQFENVQVLEWKPEVEEGEQVPADTIEITVDETTGVITVVALEP